MPLYRQTEDQAFNQNQLETQSALRRLEKAQFQKQFVEVAATTAGTPVNGPNWATGLVVVKADQLATVAITGSGGKFSVSANTAVNLTLMFV